MDFVGRCRGQVKVEISPEMEADILRKKFLPSKSTDARSQEKIYRAAPLRSDTYEEMQKSSKKHEFLWQPQPLPPMSESEATRSVLAQKLSELDQMLSPFNHKHEEDTRPQSENADLEDLERLRSCLDSQLRQMQNVLASNRMAPDGGNPTEPEVDSSSDDQEKL